MDQYMQILHILMKSEKLLAMNKQCANIAHCLSGKFFALWSRNYYLWDGSYWMLFTTEIWKVTPAVLQVLA